MDIVVDVINKCKPEAHGMKQIVKFVMEWTTLTNCIFSCCFNLYMYDNDHEIESIPQPTHQKVHKQHLGVEAVDAQSLNGQHDMLLLQ